MQAINHELNRAAPPKAPHVVHALQKPRERVAIKARPHFGPVTSSDPCFGCVDWFMYDRTRPEESAESRGHEQGDTQRS